MRKKEGSTREAAGKEAYFYKTFSFHFEFNAICVKCLNRTKNLTAIAIAAVTAARKKHNNSVLIKRVRCPASSRVIHTCIDCNGKSLNC